MNKQLYFVLLVSSLASTISAWPHQVKNLTAPSRNRQDDRIGESQDIYEYDPEDNFGESEEDLSTTPPPEYEYVTDSDNLTALAPIVGRAACQCGLSSRRIVGGEEANINEYSWTAALTRGGSRPYCGGTLINNLYVLTASHCVDGTSQKGIVVVLNQGRILQSPGAIKIPVIRVTMHESYDRRTVNNDIALLRLSRPVPLDNNSPVIPACLPATNAIDFAGQRATITGWGATREGGGVSSTLNKVTVPVLSNAQCNRESKYKGRITENMLCAGLLQSGGKDACQGDSGGPMIIENGGRRTLIGVVSWGFGCAQPLSPGVYTRVARYPDWILRHTKDAEWCQG